MIVLCLLIEYPIAHWFCIKMHLHVYFGGLLRLYPKTFLGTVDNGLPSQSQLNFCRLHRTYQWMS